MWVCVSSHTLQDTVKTHSIQHTSEKKNFSLKERMREQTITKTSVWSTEIE